MKLLLIIIILYLAYRAFKFWIHTHVITGLKYSKDSERQIDDIMIKDPVCEVYFPKRSGVTATVNGEVFYFCSEECKDKFLAKKSH
jgi:uncharacterized protein